MGWRLSSGGGNGKEEGINGREKETDNVRNEFHFHFQSTEAQIRPCPCKSDCIPRESNRDSGRLGVNCLL